MEAHHIRTLVITILMAPFVLLPASEELTIQATDTCTYGEAKVCKSKWLLCEAGPATLTDIPNPALVNNKVRPICRKQYAEECGRCGPPKLREPPLSYWGRFQLLGPWWLKFLPGGGSWWVKLQEIDGKVIKMILLFVQILSALLGLLGSAILAFSLDRILSELRLGLGLVRTSVESLAHRGDVYLFDGVDKRLDAAEQSSKKWVRLGLGLLAGSFALGLVALVMTATIS